MENITIILPFQDIINKGTLNQKMPSFTSVKPVTATCTTTEQQPQTTARADNITPVTIDTKPSLPNNTMMPRY